MAGQEAAEDRTEAPTERRLEQAREAGQLPVSRDLTMLASLGGALVGGVALLPAAAHRLAEACAGLLGTLDQMHVDSAALSGGSALGGQLPAVLLAAALLVATVALPAAACSMASVLLQTQFYIGGAPLSFKASRISPAAGLARILSWRHFLDFLKSCGRLGVLSALVWTVLGRGPGQAVALAGEGVDWLLPVARDQVAELARPLLIALVAFAVLDVFLVRFQHGRSVRMTREQVRLEMRDADGDPHVKAKLHRLRVQRSRRRMMAKVKSAAVVITNPTHYAVALAYERGGNAAPRVVAKGADLVAARIREEAAAHGVPVVPNPPLARALFTVELDGEIPAEHYRAVAEVIAFVWRLRTRVAAPGRPP